MKMYYFPLQTPHRHVHQGCLYRLFFISNTFISYAQLKLVKNQADAKQHPEAELQLFESYSHSSFMLLIKNKRRYSK